MAKNLFESIKRVNEYQSEFWSARELAKALEYLDYRNFLVVIEKTKESCKNSDEVIHNHFVDASEMVKIGSGAERKIEFAGRNQKAQYFIG